MPWSLLLNRYVIGALTALALIAGAYLKGRSDCAALHDYAAIRAERDALLNLVATERKAREADAQRLIENEALLRNLQERTEADAEALPDRDRVCLDPADTDSLRQHFRTTR